MKEHGRGSRAISSLISCQAAVRAKNTWRPSSLSSLFSRLLWLLVILGLAVYTALIIWLAFSGIFFPYQLDYGEGIVLWFTRQLALGQPIYAPPGESYASSNYPPLFMLLAAPLYGIFGDSYVWGRWLNLAAVLVVTAFIFRIVRGETRDGRAALLAAAFFLGSTFVYHWAPLYRVDLLGIALSLAGIFCVWRWEKGRRLTFDGGRSSSVKRQTSLLYLVFALLFFLGALYTKQSLLFAPTAAVVAILLRNKRAAILFAVALAVIGGAIFSVMEILTRGGWSFGLITSNATVWTARVFLPWMQTFLVTYAVLIILGAWSWGARVLRALRARETKIGVLEIYAVAAFASLALAGREGAWENYFFEAVVMICVFTGFALARMQTVPRTRWALPIVLLVQLGLFWNEHDPRIAQKLFEQTRAGNEHVAGLVRAAQGSVISEDMGLLVTNGKPVVYYTFPYSTLARAGHWDQHWELENLRAGKFPLVILRQGTRTDVDRFGNFTRAFVSALDYEYAVSSEDAQYQVYAPAPLQHFAPRAKFVGIKDSKRVELFELVGWSLEPQDMRAGQEMYLTIVWRALQQPQAGYTTFAHLESMNGAVIAQDDHEPKHGAYPPTDWAKDEMVREIYRLRVPPNLKAGEYFLRVGWYDESHERLSIEDGADFVELEKFRVR